MDTVTIPEAPELLILHPGLPLDALVEKLTLAIRWTDVGHRTLAYYLADMQERGLHAMAGYPSALHFALDRLQMSESQARSLIAAGRELREMTEIDGAFCSRRLSWSKVKLLLRVVDAETAVSVREQWLDVALKRSCRELESLVKRSEKGKPPKKAGLGLPPARFKLTLRLDPITSALHEEAKRAGAGELRIPLTDEEMVRLGAELVLARAKSGGGGGGKAAGREFRSAVNVRVLSGADSYRALFHSKDGLVELTPAEAEAIACDAGCSGHCGPDREHKDCQDDPTPEWLRKIIHERDGACVFCGRMHGLMVHHIIWRSDNGPTVEWNLLLLCLECHVNVHARFLIVEGRAPEGVRFYDANRRPLNEAGAPVPGPVVQIVKTLERAGSLGLGVDVAMVAAASATVGVPAGAAAGTPASLTAFIPRGVAGTKATGASEVGNAPPNPPARGESGTPVLQAHDHRDLAGRTRVRNGESDSGDAAPAIHSAPLSFATLPPVIDAAFYRCYSHLLSWNERRGCLQVEPGLPSVSTDDSPSLPPPPSPAAAAVADHRPRRPECLADINGQERAVRGLALAVTAAKKRGRSLPHTLLNGPPGVGKTSLALALALAAEMGCPAHIVSGPMLREPGVLFTVVSQLGARDFLFIDEIHAVPERTAEALYEAIEDFRLSLLVTDGKRTKTVTLDLPPFTLVGATTAIHELPRPFLSRFRIQETLAYLEREPLIEVLRGAARREGMALDREAERVLAEASRGTPRDALSIFQRVSDEAIANDRATIDGPFARAALEALGIDERGLGPIDRKILAMLEERGPRRPISLRRIAETIGLPLETVRDVHESYLVRVGLVAVTPRGRIRAG